METNRFSFANKCEKLKIKNSQEEKKFIKKVLSRLILDDIPDDKKKKYIINENGIKFYKCPECNMKSKTPLHNSHVGLTRSDMIDYILRDHENNRKEIAEYYNELLDMHKYIEIAVCCGKCNEKHEIKDNTGIRQQKEFERILDRIKISNLSKQILKEAILKNKVNVCLSIEKEKVKEKNVNTQDIHSLKNTPDDLFNLILNSYISVMNKNPSKNISYDQAKLFKKFYKELYNYIDDIEIYDKINSNKINNQNILSTFKNLKVKLERDFPLEVDGKKRYMIPKYSYPHSMIGYLIAHFESKQ